MAGLTLAHGALRALRVAIVGIDPNSSPRESVARIDPQDSQRPIVSLQLSWRRRSRGARARCCPQRVVTVNLSAIRSHTTRARRRPDTLDPSLEGGGQPGSQTPCSSQTSWWPTNVRVLHGYLRNVRHRQSWKQERFKIWEFAGFLVRSPLTDSNRRPPPYHGGSGAVLAGTAGHARSRFSCKSRLRDVSIVPACVRACSS